MKIGVGKRTLPSPIGEYLGGFASRTEPCKGVLDDLFVKAALFKDRGNTFLIVSLDVVCLNTALSDEIRQMICSSFGIKTESILLATSHTHSGPEIRTGFKWLPDFRSCTPGYISQVKECILESVELALSDLEEVHLFYGIGQSDIGVNRRLPLNGKIIFGPNPQGPVDKDVPVIKGVVEDGTIKVILFSYACHPSAMASSFATTDYVGAAYRLIERTLGTTALFLQGFGGNIKTDITEGKKFKEAEYEGVIALGERLGREVIKACNSPMDEIEPNLYSASVKVSIPFSRIPDNEEIEEKLKNGNIYEKSWAASIKDERILPKHIDMEIQRIDLGTELSILALSAEPVIEYLPLLRNIVTNMRIVPIGYSNGVIGYVGVSEHYKEGGYEVEGWYIHYLYPSPFAPQIQDIILQGVQRLYA